MFYPESSIYTEAGKMSRGKETESSGGGCKTPLYDIGNKTHILDIPILSWGNDLLSLHDYCS